MILQNHILIYLSCNDTRASHGYDFSKEIKPTHSSFWKTNKQDVSILLCKRKKKKERSQKILSQCFKIRSVFFLKKTLRLFCPLGRRKVFKNRWKIREKKSITIFQIISVFKIETEGFYSKPYCASRVTFASRAVQTKLKLHRE